MSAHHALTPRVFLVRHGETEWAKVGRYTGTTEVELTEDGSKQISSAAKTLVGTGKLIDPARLAHSFVSPRDRTKATFQLLLPPQSDVAMCMDSVTYTEDIAEWDYGDYEGLRTEEIKDLRRKRGMDSEREWNIWRDGCEGGESMEQVTERLDRLITRIREIQRPHMSGDGPADVLLVAHGLILRCLTKRWLGFSVDARLSMMLAPGAVAVLSYKNQSTDDPCFELGLAIPSPDDED